MRELAEITARIQYTGKKRNRDKVGRQLYRQLRAACNKKGFELSGPSRKGNGFLFCILFEGDETLRDDFGEIAWLFVQKILNNKALAGLFQIILVDTDQLSLLDHPDGRIQQLYLAGLDKADEMGLDTQEPSVHEIAYEAAVNIVGLRDPLSVTDRVRVDQAMIDGINRALSQS